MVTLVFSIRSVFFPMTDKIVVITTCAGEEESDRIARTLVELRVAACVSVIPGVRSHYRWQGTVESAQEFMLLAKTTRDKFEEFRAALEKLHSYEVPEILALPVVDGAPNYLSWLEGSLKA